MRMKIVTTCLLAGVALTASGAQAFVAPEAAVAVPRVERAILDLSDAVDLTVPAEPAALPAPTMSSGIGPGAHLLITMDGGLYSCTANFIWASGGNRYLGAAGHCFLPEGTVATHGPGNDYNRLLTSVRVCVSDCIFGGATGFYISGFTLPLGPVAYARQTQGGADVGNDFGLVQIPSSAFSQIRPSMPVWGGPVGAATATGGTVVCLYGNAVGFGETFPTMARLGVASGSTNDRWSANGPFFKGDSGSAVEECGADGGSGVRGLGAIGILTHLTIGTGTTSGTTISKARTMATQAGLSITLVNG